MTDLVNIPKHEIPGELYPILRLQNPRTEGTKYLPIVYVDELSQRIRDLVIVNSTDKNAEVEIKYEPISWGKLRLFLQFSTALRSMGDFGFKVKHKAYICITQKLGVVCKIQFDCVNNL